MSLLREDGRQTWHGAAHRRSSNALTRPEGAHAANQRMDVSGLPRRDRFVLL